jgi:hypothetical protein
MYDISLLDVPLDAPAVGTTPTSPKLICVCCNCDRVRSRYGVWYEDHTPLAGERRTHGICPDCFVALYPEYASAGK